MLEPGEDRRSCDEGYDENGDGGQTHLESSLMYCPPKWEGSPHHAKGSGPLVLASRSRPSVSESYSPDRSRCLSKRANLL